MQSKIDHPVPELPVKDVETAQAWYRDKLGFEISWTYSTNVIGAVARGKARIFFRRHDGPIIPNKHWIFSEDVDATYQECKSAGVTITDDLENKEWGLRQFTFEDLNGHIFIVFHDL